jgi:enamine deaminase RidA (YjgF/YER057c/UK114 family)
MNIQENPIRAVELELPSPPVPVANYVPVRQVGNLVFTSGQTPTRDGVLTVSGKLGRELTVEEGRRCASTWVRWTGSSPWSA